MTFTAFPRGFTVRPPTFDDLQSVVDLTVICDTDNLGFSRYSVGNMRRNWLLPGVDLERDMWLVFALGGQLVAYAKLIHLDLPRLFVNPFVHPDYVHTDLYAYLLERAEAGARELIALAPAGARVTLNTFCFARNQALPRMIEQAGYGYVRSSWRMDIDMEEPPPAPEWPAGIDLRPFTLEMARAVYAADEEAFSDHWGHMPSPFEVFEQWFLKSPGYDPTLWFIPFANEQIIGSALCEYRGELGWVGSLSIRRPWRRKGVALALLQHAFGEFYRRGTRKVGLDVDAQSLTGATRLYEKAGMHVVYQENQYQKELRPGVELSTQALEV